MNDDDVKQIVDVCEDIHKEITWPDRKAELQKSPWYVNETQPMCVRACGFNAMPGDVLCYSCKEMKERLRESDLRNDPVQGPRYNKE